MPSLANIRKQARKLSHARSGKADPSQVAKSLKREKADAKIANFVRSLRRMNESKGAKPNAPVQGTDALGRRYTVHPDWNKEYLRRSMGIMAKAEKEAAKRVRAEERKLRKQIRAQEKLLEKAERKLESQRLRKVTKRIRAHTKEVIKRIRSRGTQVRAKVGTLRTSSFPGRALMRTRLDNLVKSKRASKKGSRKAGKSKKAGYGVTGKGKHVKKSVGHGATGKGKHVKKSHA